METATYDPTGLIAGPFPIVSKSGTVLTGQNLVRGTALGRILAGAVTVAAKAGGNTGGGTLTLDATTPKLAGAKPSVIEVRAIAAATNSGTFRATEVAGGVRTFLGDFAVGDTFANKVKFVVADVGADFIVGDGFDITIAAGSKKLVKSLAAAVDGSEKPFAVLAADVDATDADRAAPYYVSGEFATSKMTFGAGHTADTVEDAFRDNNTPIFLKVLN
jgi:hypothetical protein